MTRAPSSPPRFPVWVEDETKIVNGSVVLQGGVKLVVAYPPPHTVSPSSMRERAFEKSSCRCVLGNALATDGTVIRIVKRSPTMVPTLGA